MHKYYVRFVFLALCLLPVCLSASISQELSGVDSLNVGTPFKFTIKSDNSIKSIPLPDTMESFTVIQSTQMQDSKSWQMTIVPLKLGALSFPRLQINHADAAPDSTDAFRVHVLSTLAEGDTLLRDIKPPERYPFQPGLWFYALMALIALALAVYLLVRKLRAAPKPVAPPSPVYVPKTIPAWEKALSQLDALLSEGLLERGEVLLFHFRVSEILRSFLEATYHFAAMEMTGSEIISYLRQHNVSRYTELRSFLNYCDLVKFAKAETSPEEINQRLQWLREYLNSFRPPTIGATK